MTALTAPSFRNVRSEHRFATQLACGLARRAASGNVTPLRSLPAVRFTVLTDPPRAQFSVTGHWRGDQMDQKKVKELLLQSLEHEMGGVKVYEAALKCAKNEELREEWERYLA